jgi:Zn-dependent protease
MDTIIVFQIIILILSVVIHEVAHGYAALWMGDVTAKYAGRLTLNPIKHLDMLGSIIIPGLLAISGTGFIVGWAKPVPYNPYNLKNQRWGELIVAAAGPLSNIFIAVLLSIIIRFSEYINLPGSFIQLAIISIFINLFLAVFNLVPIPPLDGSKILFNLFPQFALKFRGFMEAYSMILILIFIFFFSGMLVPIVMFFAELLTGINLF